MAHLNSAKGIQNICATQINNLAGTVVCKMELDSQYSVGGASSWIPLVPSQKIKTV